MKKVIFLLFVCCTTTILTAQNWNLFSKTDSVNYRYNNNRFERTIWIDSTSISNGDTILHFNKIVKRIDTIITQNHISGYHRDSQSSFISDSIRESPNGTIYLASNSFSFKLKPQSALRQKWLFDSNSNDSAQIVFTGLRNILGTLDSIKTIVTSKSDTFVLSKYNGLLQYPNIDSMDHSHFYISGNNSKGLGEVLPKVEDFYKYTVGGVYFCINHFSYRFGNIIHTKKIVIQNEITGSNLSYSTKLFDRRIRNDAWYNDTTYSYTSNHTITIPRASFLDHVNFQRNISTSPANNGFDSKPIYVNLDTTFNAISKSLPENNFCVVNNLIVETFSPICPSKYTFATYVIGFGRTYFYDNSIDFGVPYQTITYEQLTGAIINGVHYGNTYPDSIFTVGLNEIANRDLKFSIFPNPVNDYLEISTESKLQNSLIEIYDLFGNKVKSQPLNSERETINIESLPKGIYLLQLTSQNSFGVSKLIKE